MKFTNPFEFECPACHAPIQRPLKWFRQAGQVCPACGTSLSSIREQLENRENEWILLGNCIAIAHQIHKRFAVKFKGADFEDNNIETVADFTRLKLEVLARQEQTYDPEAVKEAIISIIKELTKVQLEVKPETRLLDLGRL